MQTVQDMSKERVVGRWWKNLDEAGNVTHKEEFGIRILQRDRRMFGEGQAFFKAVPTVCEIETLGTAEIKVDEARERTRDQGEQWRIDAG